MSTRRAARRDTGTQRCPGCRAPTLTQLVGGQRAALTITADLTPLTTAEQERARGPDRLIWCLYQRPHTPPRLRWIDAWHRANCPHPHLACHQCPPSTPSTLF